MSVYEKHTITIIKYIKKVNSSGGAKKPYYRCGHRKGVKIWRFERLKERRQNVFT